MKKITLDYTNSIVEKAEKIGVTPALLSKYSPQFDAAYKRTLSLRKSGEYGFFDLPFNNVSHIIEYVSSVKNEFENFVVLGIGGSALGNLMLHNALKPLYWNFLPSEQREGYLRLFVIDNVDPELLLGLFEVIDPRKTLFNVITKSGTTAETMANFLITLDVLKKELGADFKKNIVITTDKHKGILRDFANKNQIHSFVVPENVGGRFSVLSDVGLLSAAFEGIDIEKLLKGAAAALDHFLENPNNAIVTLTNIIYVLYREFNISLTVLMPYSNHLLYFADWFRQLWAESLGKKYDRSNNIVSEGLTPIKALGATDQHSQIQLYNEGPKDKFIIFMRILEHTYDYSFQNIDISVLSYLNTHKMSELLNTEQIATAVTLRQNNVPNATLVLPKLDEFILGKLIMFFELATAYIAELMNINAFDQPGVENAKKLTYALMGREGFESLKEEYSKKLKQTSLFTIEL